MFNRISRAAVVALGLVVAFPLVGCVMPDKLNQVQKDLADVRQELAAIEREQDEAQARLEAMERDCSVHPDRPGPATHAASVTYTQPQTRAAEHAGHVGVDDPRRIGKSFS